MYEDTLGHPSSNHLMDIQLILQKSYIQLKQHPYIDIHTLPETNISTENRGPLEKEIPIGNPSFFRGELLVSGREKKNDLPP